MLFATTRKLRRENAALAKENTDLMDRLAEALSSNSELSEQLKHLKANREELARSYNEIDRHSAAGTFAEGMRLRQMQERAAACNAYMGLGLYHGLGAAT